MNERFEADVNAIRAAITRNTVAIFASAPQFPHGTRACILQIGAETDAGVLDPIEEIGQIALSKNIPLHVDSCLVRAGMLSTMANDLYREDICSHGCASWDT